MSILIRNARILTLARGDRPRRGSVAMGELGVIERGDALVEGGRIVAVAKSGDPATAIIPPPGTTIDAAGRVLMPAFVDCHTHTCWAGSRLDEWEMKLRGSTYLEIFAAGGGIMSTVRAVRSSAQEQLERLLARRLACALNAGTTTIEVKSGYGLTTTDELKMLRAIRAAGERWQGTVVPTALLGHAVEPESPRAAAEFVDLVISETLPAVHDEFPGIAVDAFCEIGAWARDDCFRLFERARDLAHPIRVHTDQFNSTGMVPAAIRLGARSVDHLEAAKPAELAALAESSVFQVLLPVCGFHLDGRFASARTLLDHAGGSVMGGAVCIASNYNPGSAPCLSMPMVIAIAVRFCGLSVAEAITAATVNPATLLGLGDRGTIEPGARADLILLRHTDERALAFEFGCDPVDAVIAAGQLVKSPTDGH